MKPSNGLFRFLKGEELNVNHDVKVSPIKDVGLKRGGKDIAVVQESYEIEGIDPKHASDPLVIGEDGRKFVFTGVRTKNGKVVADNVRVE